MRGFCMKAVGVILIIFSLIFFGMAAYKYCVYENNEVIHKYENVYVGGDAYNYIINANYFTGFCVLGGVFFLSGIILYAVGEIKEDKKIGNISNIKDESHIFWCEKCGSTYSEMGNTTRICPECYIKLKETSISVNEWRGLPIEGKEQLKKHFKDGEFLLD